MESRTKYVLLTQVVLCLAVDALLYRSGQNGQVDDSPQARKLFHLADINNNTLMSHEELHLVFQSFDADGNDNVTSGEFLQKWQNDGFGDPVQGLRLFLNLDVNKDVVIDETNDLPYIFIFFDRNHDGSISEGEFVIQWVKISL